MDAIRRLKLITFIGTMGEYDYDLDGNLVIPAELEDRVNVDRIEALLYLIVPLANGKDNPVFSAVDQFDARLASVLLPDKDRDAIKKTFEELFPEGGVR